MTAIDVEICFECIRSVKKRTAFTESLREVAERSCTSDQNCSYLDGSAVSTLLRCWNQFKFKDIKLSLIYPGSLRRLGAKLRLFSSTPGLLTKHQKHANHNLTRNIKKRFTYPRFKGY